MVIDLEDDLSTTCIPIQVVAELTGISREGEKRKKRPHVGFEGNEGTEVKGFQIDSIVSFYVKYCRYFIYERVIYIPLHYKYAKNIYIFLIFLKDENGNTAVSTEFEQLFRLWRQKGIAIDKILDPLKRVYGESASQFISFPSS